MSARAVAAAVATVLAVGLAGCTTGSQKGEDHADQRAAASPRGTATDTGASSAEAGRERVAALTHLLDERAAAVEHHDRTAFLATLDNANSAFGRRQQAAYDALQRLPVGTFGYGTVQNAAPLSSERARYVGPDAWVATVEGRYRLAGFDRSDRTWQTSFTVVRRAGGWRLADDADGETQAQPWDLPGMQVVRSANALVVGNVAESTLRSYLGIADRAVPAVDAYWHRPWPRRLVVVAPDTLAQMHAQLGPGQGDVSQVAAVTDGTTPERKTTGSDRIVVNPQAFGQLTADGRAAVLTHEATHVAVRASLVGRVPLWLSEGTGNLVGYSVVNRPDTTLAAALVADIRRHGLPTALPSDAQFDTATTTIAPSYDQAWLAARLVDRRLGHAGLTAFYAAAASTGSDAEVEAATDRAFATTLHTTRAAFTRDWLATVRALVPTR